MSYSGKIIQEMEKVMARVGKDELKAVAEKLAGAPRIFVAGEGRSGLMGKSFAMRLMHLGATVFAVGETITPALKKGDLLVAVSGSGQTRAVVEMAEKARKLDCDVIAFTSNPESDLTKSSTDVLYIPAATKYRRSEEPETIQPLGSLFDQCLHVVQDAICLYYADLKEEGQDSAFGRHSNLE
ncbi:MAG TPA: 6-phospho-3-hexuloisomerase [Bacillales bacterium]|nr:6-phospho-3-hexuloisomerase [Bacillales bacterium]